MKNILTILSFALIALTLANGCKKDPKRTTSAHYVTATASDGTSVDFTDTLAHAGKNGYPPDQYIEVSGWTTDFSTSPRTGFWMYFYTATPGTYTLDGVLAGAYYNQVASLPTDSMRNSAHGTVIITAVSPNLTGTISFTCKDSTVVSGSFNVVAP